MRVLLPTLGLALMLAAAPAGAEPCRPRVVVLGDTAPAEELEAALASRGVVVGGSPECPGTRITVHELDGRFLVEVLPAGGTAVSREVGTIAVAQAWIESWVLPAELWVAEDPAPTPVAAPRPPVAATRAAPARRATVFAVALRIERASGNDDSTWQSTALGACIHWRGWCLGPVLRYAANQDWGETSRRAVDALMEATPLAYRPYGLVPSMGLGVGRLRTLHDPTEVGRYEAVTWAPRVTFGLGLPWHLTRILVLEAQAGLDVVPGAADRKTMTNPDLSLPAEPTLLLRLGLSLRLEVP